VIVFENAPQPCVRAGEFDLAGRRVTARAFPYGGASASAPWSFDPIERLFHLPAAQSRIEVGPHDPEAWRDALARNPAGSVAIGAGHCAEEIRGAYRAAAQGAAGAGRGVFLLDPPASGLPPEPSEAFVAAFVMLPGHPAPEGLAGARERGFLAGVIVPLVPGWTCEVPALQDLIGRAEESGARFVAGVPAAEDGPGRRAVVEVRARLEPESPDEFFERVHHRDGRAETEDARARIREACGGRALSFGMPRPVGHLEPAANARAARQLEDKAEALFAQNEHRASLLHAAARWIEESGRDLAPIVVEGNFRKIFPFEDEIAREAEAAFRSER
jgi:hypothetical protein